MSPWTLSRLLGAVVAATPLAYAHDNVHSDYEHYNKAEWGPFPTNFYHSAPIKTPQLQVNMWNKAAMSQSGSHILLRHDGHSTGSPERDSSPLIIRTDDLSAVYANRSFPAVANVNVHSWKGTPLLTFYGGQLDHETGIGNGYIFAYDQEYHEVGRVSAEHLDGVGADAHEFTVTADNTGIVTAYDTIRWDLSPYTDAEDAQDGYVRDSLFQEINLDTFEVIFQWRASEHIDMSHSYKPIKPEELVTGWDFFHINSVQKSKEGNFLISARNTHALYMISGKTGDVLWTLGGKANEFEELDYPQGAHFSNPLLSMAWQHHAQFYPGRDEKEITLFDNHGDDINGWGCTENCSRGVHFALDAASKRVQLLHEYLHPVGLWSINQGSMQVLDNGNVFIGWGRNPAVTEHLPDGDCIFDVQFSPWRSPDTDWDGLDSYRAYKVDWVAAPYWPPAITAEKGTQGDLTAWVSWNGATEVAEWVLLGSPKERDLDGPNKVVARAKRDGFETALWVEKREDVRFLRAVAKDAHGKILRASDIFDLRDGSIKPGYYPVTNVDERPKKGGDKGQGGSKEAGGSSGSGSGSSSSSSSSSGQTKGNRPGLPVLEYYDAFPHAWSWSGLALPMAAVALGVYLFTRFF